MPQTTIYPFDEAHRISKYLSDRDEDGWKYKIKPHTVDGAWFIEVRDSDDHLLGTL